MPPKSAHVKNVKQYEGLKERAGGDSRQGGTTAQHKAAGRKGGRATAKKK